MRPRIGITCGYQIVQDGRCTFPCLSLNALFCDAVYSAGGVPVIIPPTEDAAALLAVLETLDGLILTGGHDVPPECYGAAPHSATKALHPRRAASDFRVARFADERELPLLAICCGIQEWNVHRGGTLHQHLPDLPAESRLVHSDGDDFSSHPVRLEPGSLVESILRTNPATVNSSHHQGLDRIGRDLMPTAWSQDGLVEAVEDPRRRFCLGVQWHPEYMVDDPAQQRLLAAVVEAAK
ncbi:MAG TPA: gamma-glutamyl-gamma-aminobutyrate hydrolase family protein [Phycisphaerae bacterium]|nr:gamma-glutamyl-gamma-aminobutyrate hydrolase family protein [Phycisphaerae bacterium]